MTPEKTDAPTPLEPVTVAVIGSGSITGGPAPITSGTEAQTPGVHQPNLRIQVVQPLVALVIRFINAYLMILVGLVAAGMTSDAIPYDDFAGLLVKCAGLSIAGAAVGSLKDLVTIFGRLETKFPLLTGNV